jgi:hypothetical protein
LDQLDVVSGVSTFVEIARARIRSAGKGHINGRVTVTLVKSAG